MYNRAALAAATALMLATRAAAQPSTHCTHEILNVRGVPVSASYCVIAAGPAAGHDLPVRVQGAFTSARGSVSHDALLRFLAGAATSRAMDDVPLDRLGMSGTLHLTLELRGGLVHIDGAMITPGAIWVK